MDKTIKVHVRHGCVYKVSNIPDGYVYVIIDDDILDEDALDYEGI